jgi:hypothetical protein
MHKLGHKFRYECVAGVYLCNRLFWDVVSCPHTTSTCLDSQMSKYVFNEHRTRDQSYMTSCYQIHMTLYVTAFRH